VEITAKKVPGAATRLADIESQLRSGEKASEETWLDAILNPASFPFLLGGETAKARAARARHRAEVLGWERVMLLSLEVEKSPAEKERIKADLEMLNTILRSWR
jgi:tetrahydromethanopterin S-methyltransferase subunit H